MNTFYAEPESKTSLVIASSVDNGHIKLCQEKADDTSKDVVNANIKIETEY